MGLTAGPVPPRVDAPVKAGLLTLVDHAAKEGGWSLRRAATTLGLDHARVLRWQARAVLGRLEDARPGPTEAPHALLDHEREAILKIAEDWNSARVTARLPPGSAGHATSWPWERSRSFSRPRRLLLGEAVQGHRGPRSSRDTIIA